jgi:glycosyltransferase involved in cell wall biosynthesis
MPKTFRKLSKSEVSKGRRGVAIDTRARVVLMVAAFRAEKRHTLALEICKRIIETRRDVVFVFLGAGPNRQAFISEVRSLGLEKNIIAPGHVDNVDDYYTIADVSMLTSYCEPFGYVVLEAIQHGLPVIAFDNGGPGEVIHNGETGILVPEGDIEGFSRCLLELLDNAKLREVIGEQGRLSVEQDYDRTRWIRRVNTILANAVLRGQQRLPGSLKREGKHAEEEGLR